MARVIPTLCTTVHFPSSVAEFLITRFPDLIGHLVHNDKIEPVSFSDVPAAKQSADTAAALLALKNPSTISEWCKSRDKRQITTEQVLRYWHLPLTDQLQFASKAVSADTARTALRSEWFSDKAKFAISIRANGSDVWDWLESEPAGLTDDEWFEAFVLAASSATDLTAAHSAMLQRPHLSARLVEHESGTVAALAVAMVPWISPDRALARIESMTGTSFESGLVAFVDHPSLPTEFRVKAFELAATRGVLEALHREGCPSPGSALDLGIPLSSIEDPLVLELVTMRSCMTPVRLSHFVQAVAAPAASSATVARCYSLPVSMLQTTVSFNRALLGLARRVGVDLCLQSSLTAEPQKRLLAAVSERAHSQAAAAALAEPTQHTAARSRYMYHYGNSDAPAPTPNSLLDTSIEELPGKISGYRSSTDAPEILSALLVERLGDGSDEKSKSNWENFFQLLSRTATTVKFKMVLNSASRLS